MRRVGGFPRNSETLKKVRALLTSSYVAVRVPNGAISRQVYAFWNPHEKIRRVGVFPPNSETFEKVRVRLTSSSPKLTMWSFGANWVESRNKFRHSGIPMKIGEGG